MPVQFIRTGEGCAARWGNKGHEYPYTCGDVKARAEAKKKALGQGVAIGEYEYTLHEKLDLLRKFTEDGEDRTTQ